MRDQTTLGHDPGRVPCVFRPSPIVLVPDLGWTQGSRNKLPGVSALEELTAVGEHRVRGTRSVMPFSA